MTAANRRANVIVMFMLGRSGRYKACSFSVSGILHSIATVPVAAWDAGKKE
jgi:hypothetical protein